MSISEDAEPRPAPNPVELERVLTLIAEIVLRMLRPKGNNHGDSQEADPSKGGSK